MQIDTAALLELTEVTHAWFTIALAILLNAFVRASAFCFGYTDASYIKMEKF